MMAHPSFENDIYSSRNTPEENLSSEQVLKSNAKEMIERMDAADAKRFCPTITNASIPELLRLFIELFECGILKEKWNLRVTLQDAMANIDRMIHQQLNEILHHQAMQRLEATWRGLSYLIAQAREDKQVRFRVFSVKKRELLQDFDRSIEFDQSTLFKAVYEAEFGTHGGTPFSILVGDYEFNPFPADVALLKHISGVAAAAHTPFITGTAPEMFEMDRFGELGIPKDLKKMFRRKEWTQWNSFRKIEDSRYVVLTLPRILLRLPYGRRKKRLHPGSIYLEEKVGGVHPDKYLWGNAAYALASRIVDSFIRTGWFSSFSGLENGGVINNLPVPFFDAIDIPKMSVDVCVPDLVERELSNLGFICLMHRRWTTDCVFYGRQTVHQPKRHWTRQARANARLSSMLPHMLVASRFAHYMKSMLRDKVGSFQNRNELEKHLNDWIAQFILIDPLAPAELKEQYPLLEAKIDLIEAPDTPGKFTIISYLRPHLQLEEVSASIRLFSNVTTRNR